MQGVNWEITAKATIAYKNLVKAENASLRLRIKNLEDTIEAMGEFIEEQFGDVGAFDS